MKNLITVALLAVDNCQPVNHGYFTTQSPIMPSSDNNPVISPTLQLTPYILV